MKDVRWIHAALAVVLVCAPVFVSAQTAEDIQHQIDQHNAAIAQLDKEIAQYQAQLDAVSSKKQTLQNTLDQLNISIKKTAASVSATKQKIGTIQLQIQQLEKGIAGKQASIESGEAGLSETIRTIHESDAQPLALYMLSGGSISDAWDDLERTESLQSAVQVQIKQLSTEKQSLTDTKTQTEAKRAELVKQQNTLVAQQGSLTATKKAQNELLSETKSQESNYQTIIAQKKAQEADFENALNDLQSQLQYAVNPSQVPTAGAGILRWPVDNVRVTQYFGNTAFAASGAYNGKGHNGIDLAVSIGTPIRATLGGTVLGTGNTDAVRSSTGKQCYSFGKWVMIKHANGLNTMYAHLSQINVSQGQTVSTGQVIGYSGITGYATGPHLHFGVYLSSATEIIKLADATKSSTPCANAVMPVAPLAGYLNPMNYLPAI